MKEENITKPNLCRDQLDRIKYKKRTALPLGGPSLYTCVLPYAYDTPSYGLNRFKDQIFQR